MTHMGFTFQKGWSSLGNSRRHSLRRKRDLTQHERDKQAWGVVHHYAPLHTCFNQGDGQDHPGRQVG